MNKLNLAFGAKSYKMKTIEAIAKYVCLKHLFMVPEMEDDRNKSKWNRFEKMKHKFL